MKVALAALALVAASLASGHAAASVCVGEPGVRACAGGTTIGPGSGASPSPFWYGENAVTVDARAGSTTHSLYVSHCCYAFLTGPYSGHGSGITASYHSSDAATGEYRGAGAYWAGFAYANPGGAGAACYTTAFTSNVPVVGYNVVPVGCTPLGAPPGPPLVLP